MTKRENIWMDDLPVAAVDAVASSPVIFYVYPDHLSLLRADRRGALPARIRAAVDKAATSMHLAL